MFTANYLSSEHRYRELDTCFNKPKGKKSSCSPFLTMNSYPNLKKIGVKDCVFTTKQDQVLPITKKKLSFSSIILII